MATDVAGDLSRRTLTIAVTALGRRASASSSTRSPVGQDVPTWLDLHVQQHAQDAYHWITQNTGRNVVLDAIKSIGTGIDWWRSGRCRCCACCTGPG